MNSDYIRLTKKIDKLNEEQIEVLQELITLYEVSRNFYKQRCELLQQVQKHMRDPERTIVCDILANNTLLPDPEGKRYGLDLVKEIGEPK
jgi:hypothetical protein